MHPLIEKYGKPLMREILDIVMIGEELNNAQARHLLIKHGHITQHTKTVSVEISKNKLRYDPMNNQGDRCTIVTMRNGRGEVKVGIRIFRSHIKQLLEELE